MSLIYHAFNAVLALAFFVLDAVSKIFLFACSIVVSFWQLVLICVFLAFVLFALNIVASVVTIVLGAISLLAICVIALLLRDRVARHLGRK